LAFEEKLKELQERVGHLMIDIMHHITPENEEGSDEALVKAVKGVEEDIKRLLRCGTRIVVRDGC
jgi:hypothetical protein